MTSQSQDTPNAMPQAALAESRALPRTDQQSADRQTADERLALAEFDSVVRENQRGIFRLLLGWTCDEERADALTQETFLRAWRHRSGFRGDAAVSTWLRRIAVHVAEDDRRSRRQGFWRRILRRPDQGDGGLPDGMPLSLPSAEPSAERSLLDRERLDAVWRAVGSLPERQQQVFRLRHLGELPLREIAEVLGLAEGTVKVHLFRATQAVRTASNKTLEPEETTP